MLPDTSLGVRAPPLPLALTSRLISVQPHHVAAVATQLPVVRPLHLCISPLSGSENVASTSCHSCTFSSSTTAGGFSCRTASLWAAFAESGGLRIASWPAVGMIRKVVCQAAAAEQMLFKLDGPAAGS